MKYNFINDDGLIYLGQVLLKYEGKKKDVVIPEGITRIHHEAFIGTEITSVTFPNSLQIVGSNVFSNCKNLKEVVFPESVKRIGRDVFSGCNLDRVVFPCELDELGDNRQTMGEVVLPEKVSDFNCTFSGYDLCTITITPAIEHRKQNDSCFIWDIVKTPSRTTKIPKYFLATANVRKVIVSGNIEKIPLKTCASNYYLEEVILEEGVKQVASTAFDFSYLPTFLDGDSKHITIAFPSSVEEIGKNFLRITKNSERSVLFKVHADSYAHKFALKNNFHFELV